MNKRLKEIFLSESIDNTVNIKSAASKLLDPKQQKDNLELIARYLHTIKGSSRMMGYKAFSSFIHAIEDKVKSMRNIPDKIDSSFINFLYSVADKIISILSDIDNVSDEEIESLTEEISKLQDFSSYSHTTNDKITSLPFEEDNSNLLKQNIYKIHEIELNQHLQNLYNMISKSENLFFLKSNIISLIESIFDNLKSLKSNIADEKYKNFIQNIIQTNEIKLHNLSNDLEKIITDIKISSRINHETALSFKMLKFKEITQTLKESAKTLAAELGKDVKIIIKGEDIKFDKDILLKLQEPLIHLIRNSVDHGLETPAERIKKNKNPEGTIEIECIADKNYAKITIKDDGRGININKIRNRAKSLGYNVDDMSDNEVIYLIFQSSFSTKDKTTDISGRGEGLYIVKDVMNKVGGKIEIDHKTDLFTKFSLIVPVSFMETEVLIFHYAGLDFALFLNSIESIMTFDESKIIYSDNAMLYTVNDNAYKFSYTSDILNCENDLNNYIIFINYRGKIFGITAKDIKTNSKMKLYKYGGLVEHLKTYSHFIANYDGSVIPLIDLDYLYEKINQITPVKQITIEDTKERPKVLLVEDSFATRELEKHILLTAGFDVIEATNGKEALNIFNNRDDIKIIISDIEMPEMDGYTLTKQIRTGVKNPNIPIILISTLSDKESINKGLKSGANFFITKSQFSGEEFLDKIRSLIGAQY
ncbi:response regulator [Deferribacter autotrophicus]|uniref:histidine kinase n=1 Tax=Deferribacter autotrophicus TaxID=500465 RepID=A0A5A8F0A1_9BACT|nr:response regulator [Deferribacter autotrophicus]KAA0257083.1 response regulator [Deferribacter autotrophicus]